MPKDCGAYASVARSHSAGRILTGDRSEGGAGLDIGQILRLREAIRGALDASPPADAVLAARPMTTSYDRLRKEVAQALSDSERVEFDRLFPELGWGAGVAAGERAEQYHKARALLASLAGWLDGFVAEARMALEAKEYGEARAREERGVGFRGSDPEDLDEG